MNKRHKMTRVSTVNPMSYWTWVSDLFILSLPFLNRSSPALHVPSSVSATCNLHEAFSEGYLMYVRFWALTKQPHSDVKYQATTTTYKGWKAPVVGYKTPSKHREQTRRIISFEGYFCLWNERQQQYRPSCCLCQNEKNTVEKVLAGKSCGSLGQSE